jgi:hypothetical protein
MPMRRNDWRVKFAHNGKDISSDERNWLARWWATWNCGSSTYRHRRQVEAARGNSEGDIRADEGVVRHEVDFAKPGFLRIQTGEHLWDLAGDTPGNRELVGGRQGVLRVIGAISKQSPGYPTKERLRTRVECVGGATFTVPAY